MGALCFSNTAAAKMTVTLDKANNAAEQKIAERLETSLTLQTATNFLNTYFFTPYDVVLSFGSYDRVWHHNGRIEIPYLFIQDIRDDYRKARFDHKKTVLDDYTGNVLLHVIFHEFAHTLIDQYDFSVLGKEEDAADTFADVILIQFFEGGSDVVISAADLFFINDGRMRHFTKEDFWSEHSLDKQRYYGRLCNAYGSNPSAYNTIKLQAGFDDEKAERCTYQYQQIKDSWFNMLAPAFTPAAQTQ
jgi:hypothetical protein